MEKRIKELENSRKDLIKKNDKIVQETIEILNNIDKELKQLREKLEQEYELDDFIRKIAKGGE